MSSAALETLRRLRKKGRTTPTPEPSRPPLRVVETPAEEDFEVRIVPLEELTKTDRLVIRATFGSDREE